VLQIKHREYINPADDIETHHTDR